MRIEDAPEGVFWVSYYGGRISRACINRYDGDARLLMFGPGCRTGGQYVTSGSERGDAHRREALEALGYAMPMQTFQTRAFRDATIVGQPANPTPLPMVDGRPDPAVSSVAELPEYKWVRITDPDLVRMTGVTGPVPMLINTDGLRNVLFGTTEMLPRGHRPTHTSTPPTETAARSAFDAVGLSGEMRYWYLGDERLDRWEECAPPSVFPTRPEDLKPGDWFSWGNRVWWFRVARIFNGVISVNMRATSTQVVNDGVWGPYAATLVTNQFTANPADHPARLVEWLAHQEPEAPDFDEPEVSAHAADIATIGRILIAEAESREWCGEYDSIVARINREISVPLPIRNGAYVVTYTPAPTPPAPLTSQVVFTSPPTNEEVSEWLALNHPGATLQGVEPA